MTGIAVYVPIVIRNSAGYLTLSGASVNKIENPVKETNIGKIAKKYRCLTLSDKNAITIAKTNAAAHGGTE